MSKPTGSNTPRVLVVEDDELLRKVLCQTIQRIGFVAIPTANGEVGLEKLQSEPVNIVVSDIMMPKMTGLELLQKSVALGFIQPFIIISSQNKRDILMQALKLGAFDFIDKPFQASVISQVLDEAFRYSQRLTQFASTLHIGESSSQKVFSLGEMEKFYLLRLIEATTSPFGSASSAVEKLGQSSQTDGDRFFFETSIKALEGISKRLDGMSKFLNTSLDVGVILRNFHSIKMAAGGRLNEQTEALLDTLEDRFALLRLFHECMNKDILSAIQLSNGALVQAFAAQAAGKTVPELNSAFTALEKFEARLNKSL
jgi:two-component system response regulator VicR